MKTRTAKATLCLFAASLIWGVSFVAQVVGMDYVKPFTFNGISFLIGAASLLPVLALSSRGAKRGCQKGQAPAALHVHVSRRDRPLLASAGANERTSRWTQWKPLLPYGAILGAILFCAANLQQFGVEGTGSAGKSGFITGLYIIIVPIFGIFLKRPAGLFIWFGAALAVIGLYLLSVPPGGLGGMGRGDALLFAGAFFWALHILTIDRFVAHADPLKLSFLQFLFCGGFCLIAAIVTGEPITAAALSGAAFPLLFRGIASVGVAYTLQTVGQRDVAPAKASVIFSLESVFAALGGAVLIHEIMSGRSYLGCALIFAGILLSQIPRKSPVK